MSLLMEALKRAEQEKKQAAGRIQDSEAIPGTADDEAIVLPQAGAATADAFKASREEDALPLVCGMEVVAEQPSAGVVATTKPAAEPGLAFETMTAAAGDPAARLATKAGAASPSPKQTSCRVELDMSKTPLSQQPPSGHRFADDPDPDDSRYESLPGVSAEQLSRDIGEADRLTPVTAQTVFSAASGQRVDALRWRLPAGLVAMVLLAVGGGMYRFLPASASDRQQPAVSDAALAAVEQATAQPGEPITGLEPADEASSAAWPDAVAKAGGEAMAGVPVRIVPDGTAAPDEPAPAPASTTTQQDKAGQLPTAEDEPSSPAGQFAVRPPARSSYLQISKATGVVQEAMAVQRAYQSYQQGKLAEANTRYQEVLTRHPDNRDALLGLAAIAIRQADTDTAAAIYTRLLTRDADDTLARTALIGLQDNRPMADRERDIKSMLLIHPDNPLLHFALGRMYAAGQRWSLAQQAFFAAYRLDADNPGYALNLAISLDRIGQPQAALDYYQRTLVLAVRGDVAIDVDTVRHRIQTLSMRVPP